MNYYIDMDGVLVDFCGKFNQHFNTKLVKRSITPTEWLEINNTPDFWISMDDTPGAADLMTWMKNYVDISRTYILSAGPHCCHPQKEQWIEEHFPRIPSHNVILLETMTHKVLYARDFTESPPNVLIDDFQRNIDEWYDYGGIGIKYTNTPDTLNALSDVMMMKTREKVKLDG